MGKSRMERFGWEKLDGKTEFEIMGQAINRISNIRISKK